MALNIVDVEYEDLKGRTLTFPVGNTGNVITARYTIENEFRVELSNSIQVTKIGNKFTLSGTTSGGQAATWENFGIISDETVFFGLYSSGFDIPSGSETVQFINGAELFMVNDPDNTINNVTYFVGNFKQLITPEGVEIDFNIASNDSPNQYSLIDGEPTRFTVDNVNFTAVGTTLPMVQLGNRSGSSEVTANLLILADGLGDKAKYVVEVKFKYPHYLFPTIFDEGNSVAPWVTFRTMPQYANLNCALETVYAPQGNVGFRDEHFNGTPSPYTFNSIVWTKTNNSVIASMDYSQPSKFTILITGNFDVACQFNIGWFWNPINEEDYQNLPTSHDQNVMLVTKTSANSTIFGPETITGYTNSAGAQLVIQDLSYTLIGSGPGAQLKITGKTVPNTEFIEWFDVRDGDRRYQMWIDCDESAFNFDWNSSTSTNVEVADAQMIKSVVILGAWDDITYNKFLDHNDDEHQSPTVYTEDDLNMVIKFRLPRNISFNSIGGSIVAYNALTSESFVLESNVVSILPNPPSFPFLSDGTLPIDSEQTRGFKLPNGSGKNVIKLDRLPAIDNVTSYGLTFNYGFLCRWEYWLSQANAAPYFFNNQNKNWQQFQGSGWGLKFVFNVNTANGSYENGYDFRIKAYDDYIGNSFTEFFKLDGTQINAPLATEQIRVKTTHVIDSPYDWDTPHWANMTVEPKESAIRWLLSSRTFPLDGLNPLSPLVGETGVKITMLGDTITTECLFDPMKLQANSVSFTGRIQAEEIPEITGIFIYEDSDGILTEEGDNLILEHQ